MNLLQPTGKPEPSATPDLDSRALRAEIRGQKEFSEGQDMQPTELFNPIYKVSGYRNECHSYTVIRKGTHKRWL